MRENYLSYSEVVDYFGQEKIANRFKFIYDKMTKYIEERGMEDKLYVNRAVLQQVVLDYFVDVFRLKEFHKIDKIDKSKILAYESYWILRRKPIQCMSDALDAEMDDRLIFANEGYLTTSLAHEMLMPQADEPMSKEEENAFLDFLQHLNYHLKYRSVDKQTLELMLMAYKTGRKAE